MCEVWIKLPLYYRTLICVARVVRRPRQHLAVLCKSDEFRAAGSSWLGSAEIMYGGQRFRHRYFSKAAILWLQYNTMRWKRSDSFLQRENHSRIGASSKQATYTTVRLTTAEVAQHPHVCPVHKLQYILYFCRYLFHLI